MAVDRQASTTWIEGRLPNALILAERTESRDRMRIRALYLHAIPDTALRPFRDDDCRGQDDCVGADRPYSALAAARTSSAWPATFTFGHIRAMRPCASISTVVRTTPMKVWPYMLFSAHTP